MLSQLSQRLLEKQGLKREVSNLKAKSKRSKLILKGVPLEAQSFVLRGVPPFWEDPVLIVTENRKAAEKLFRELTFDSGSRVYLFPEFLDEDTEETRNQKQATLQQILIALEKNQPVLIVSPIADLDLPLINPRSFQEQKVTLKLKQTFAPEKLAKFLTEQGYVSQKRIDVPGTFSWRGGMIDIYLPNYSDPLRIEFSGDQIESILRVNQRSGEVKQKLGRVTIRQLKILDSNSKNDLLDYCQQSKVVFVALSPELKLKDKPQIIFDNFPTEEPEKVFDLGFRTVPPFWHQMEILTDDLINKQKNGWQIIVATKHQDLLKHYLKQQVLLQEDLTQPVQPVKVEGKNIFPIVLFDSPENLNSFQNSSQRFLLLTDWTIFRRPLKFKRSRQRKVDQDFILSLKPGGYVVHVDHGIGKFKEMVKRTVEGVEREYFLLNYALGDKLFVPVDQADRISCYVGVENPTLNRLSGIAWQQVKIKVKSRAREVARRLLELYAQREFSQGHAFSEDSELQKELEQAFPYQETPDQLHTLEEVKRDLENVQVMDRLICGDVGFGKTEIALRAAFKVVMDKKQVALLAPTTILVEQHAKTFLERLKNFPVRVESISRFKTKKEQEQILADLKTGKIDILIGTHRLLQKDIQFANLGLVIVDEEQRFGVEHKERFKEMRNNVDILTLSATPIPRTLNLALGGVRSISTITTPPPGRLPVETFVNRYSDEIVKEAIERELKRNGQVYFLHNRVQTIESAAYQIRKLVPRAKVVVAHGQMESRQLEKIMEDFYHGKYNVLVCSSIIENGLDVPTVNTLIVDDAVNFGLSQLYQLRGRIGRSHLQAYAYFLYQGRYLKGLARRRLEALLEAQKLGSGFEIAMRDLEIRGAGNVLGTEQHGHIVAVGLSLYARLLQHAVEELKAGKHLDEVETTVDLPLPDLIPVGFIADEQERIKLYQKLTSIVTLPELFNLHDQLKREHQTLPQELENLFAVLEIKLLAHEAGIIKVESRTVSDLSYGTKTKVLLVFRHLPDPKLVAKLLKQKPAWRMYQNQLKIDLEDLGEDWVGELKKDLEILRG
jgi:transcription-repair coupling factor (superfamily II helicase)